MGKIRIKTLGDAELEEQQAAEAQKRREAKKAAKAEDVVDGAGDEIAVVTEEESTIAPDSQSTDTKASEKKSAKKSAKKPTKEEASPSKAVAGAKSTPTTGKKARTARAQVDASRTYAIEDAVKLIKDISYARFDETLEVHVKLKEQGLKGNVELPHGTGKEVKVAIADDKLLKEIEAGNITFDVLITTPAFMPKLVPFARVLGPKGLMPNPKNGTVADNPEEAATKFQGGNVQFKSEAKAPLVHQAVGKLSFGEDKLAANVRAFLAAVNKKNILAAYIAGTMTPSVRVELE